VGPGDPGGGVGGPLGGHAVVEVAGCGHVRLVILRAAPGSLALVPPPRGKVCKVFQLCELSPDFHMTGEPLAGVFSS
jgi:hypothetical protein